MSSSLELFIDCLSYFPGRDYYAALLRTTSGYVAPTQGKLLNYVQRIPLGVVAQITVRLALFLCAVTSSIHVYNSHSTTHFSSPSRKLPLR